MPYGSGEFTYELVPEWAKLPGGWKWDYTASVAVDREDNVWALSRGDHPVMVFDRHGNFVKSWGEGQFGRPHGISISPDQMVWVSDDAGHVVRKYSMDGTLLLTLGTQGQPSDSGYVLGPSHEEPQRTIKRGAGPFNRPTLAVVAPWGETYVSDGYGNARVHRFSAEGQLINSWGEPGAGPGQFQVVHGVAIDGRGRVLVMDRDNNRVQLFTRSGEFLDQWPGMKWPSYTVSDRAGRLFIAHRPQLVTIKDLDGNTLGGFGASDVLKSNHSIGLNSMGDIFIGESPREGGAPTLLKFARVS